MERKKYVSEVMCKHIVFMGPFACPLGFQILDGFVDRFCTFYTTQEQECKSLSYSNWVSSCSLEKQKCVQCFSFNSRDV